MINYDSVDQHTNEKEEKRIGKRRNKTKHNQTKQNNQTEK
jgi:hypothetical protein